MLLYAPTTRTNLFGHVLDVSLDVARVEVQQGGGAEVGGWARTHVAEALRLGDGCGDGIEVVRMCGYV